MQLIAAPSGCAQGAGVRDLADALGVPQKFLPRALALLTRRGVVTLTRQSSLRLTLNRHRLAYAKNPAQKVRDHIARALRIRLLQADGHRCGRCGRIVPPEALEIDHIVPVSLLGADAPGNWVSLCKADNRRKRDGFNPRYLRYYRGQRIRGAVGARFKAGFLWPHINGQTRVVTRVQWAADGQRGGGA